MLYHQHGPLHWGFLLINLEKEDIMKQIWFNSSLHGLAPTTVYSDYNDRKLIAMKCFLPVFRNCFFLNGHKTLKNRTKLSPLVLWRFYADVSCSNSSVSLTNSHQKQLYLQLCFPVVFTEMIPMFSLNDEFWKKLYKMSILHTATI